MAIALKTTLDYLSVIQDVVFLKILQYGKMLLCFQPKDKKLLHLFFFLDQKLEAITVNIDYFDVFIRSQVLSQLGNEHIH